MLLLLRVAFTRYYCAQLIRREIAHQGLQVEANATALVLKLVQLPAPSPSIATSSAWHALLKRLLSVSIRVQGKGMAKTWTVEFVFYGSPLSSSHPKEQGIQGSGIPLKSKLLSCKFLRRFAKTGLFSVRYGNGRHCLPHCRCLIERLGADSAFIFNRSRFSGVF